MSAVLTSRDFYLEDYPRVAPTLPAADLTRMTQLRQAALARFKALGFPSPRDEDWKYTRLSSFEQQFFSPALTMDITTDEAALQALPWSDLPGFRWVFVDGHYAPQLSSSTPLPEGVSVTSLAQAIADENEAVMQALERAIQTCANGFDALNLAYVSDGVLLRVASNTKVQEPINLVYVNQGRADSVAHVRNLLLLGQGSEASVTEHYVGLGENNYFTNSFCDVQLADNARLDVYKLQQEGIKSTHIAGMNVTQQAHSHFASHYFSLGGQLARQDIGIDMAAAGADCLINALLLGNGRQHMDLHTRVEHGMPHCTSREYVRGIMDDRARGVLDGRVIVHPQAQKTDAHLASHNLLLSRFSEMDVKPQLEIYADDVKCSHGATVGQLDKDALFYLRSRGLDEDAARALVTYAFANEILGRVPFSVLRARCQNLLITQMPQAGYIQELL